MRLDSINTLTTKMNSMEKNKSNTMTSIPAPISIKRIKSTNVQPSEPMTPLKKNTESRMRQRSNVKFYDEEEERF